MSNEMIKKRLELEKEFMENNVCPKCGSKNWQMGYRSGDYVYDLRCANCGHLIYDINPIKSVCHELNLTYKQLGEAIGFSGDTLNNMASKPNDKLSVQLIRAIELYLETINLKKELEKLESLKAILKDLVK